MKITDLQLFLIRKELERVNDKGLNGAENDYGTWEAVGYWHGMMFVLEKLNIKI